MSPGLCSLPSWFVTSFLLLSLLLSGISASCYLFVLKKDLLPWGSCLCFPTRTASGTKRPTPIKSIAKTKPNKKSKSKIISRKVILWTFWLLFTYNSAVANTLSCSCHVAVWNMCAMSTPWLCRLSHLASLLPRFFHRGITSSLDFLWNSRLWSAWTLSPLKTTEEKKI